MTGLIRLGGGAIIAAVCAMTVKKSSSGMGGAASVIGAAVILGSAISVLSEVLIRYAGLSFGSSESYIVLMLKALGVGITVKTVTDVCAELGEEGIAGGVVLAGKAEILLLCLPTVKEVIGMLTELMK